MEGDNRYFSLLLLTLFVCVLMSMCVNVCTHACVGIMFPCIHAGQKRVSDPFELELQAFARCSDLLRGS